MAIHIVRLGTRRAAGEGPRLGTVRRPPRGVPKAKHASENWYDVWLPNLAPSAALMRQTNIVKDKGAWATFERRYRAEMKTPDAAHVLETLATLSQRADFSVGCYCENEQRCHRSILRSLLDEHGAKIALA